MASRSAGTTNAVLQARAAALRRPPPRPVHASAHLSNTPGRISCSWTAALVLALTRRAPLLREERGRAPWARADSRWEACMVLAPCVIGVRRCASPTDARRGGVGSLESIARHPSTRRFRCASCAAPGRPPPAALFRHRQPPVCLTSQGSSHAAHQCAALDQAPVPWWSTLSARQSAATAESRPSQRPPCKPLSSMSRLGDQTWPPALRGRRCVSTRLPGVSRAAGRNEMAACTDGQTPA